jgi:hypothetical protein
VGRRNCDDTARRGRLKKAEQFLQAARTIETAADDGIDINDAYVTLCVHAGIAAADALCCRALGQYHQGDNHNEAVTLLSKVDKKLAEHLRTLLGMKTLAGYTATPIGTTRSKQAGRAAEHLVQAALNQQ